MIPAYVVNMRHDHDKYLRISEALSKYPFIWHRRIDAVSGGTLPDQLCRSVTRDGNSVNAKGALGCMLSHVRAWEILLAGVDPWAIVLEDDAMLRDWSDLPELQFPPDFDIIFANNRTELADPPKQGRIFTPMHDVLLAMEARARSVGTDCYIISRAGAKKLLPALQADGYGGHIDFRLLAYSLPPEEAAAILPEGKILAGIRNNARMSQAVFLRHFSMSPSLVDHHAVGETSRIREDRLGSSRLDVAAHEESRISRPGPATHPLLRYDHASMADPPETDGLVEVLEAPARIARRMPAFIADLSGRELSLATPPWQYVHGSYLVRREDVLLFGPNHVVSPAGFWSCEARSFKEQFLWYLDQDSYNKMYPGTKPRLAEKAQRGLRTAAMQPGDATVLDMPVFLATPLEPPNWGRWIATVAPKVMQFKLYGQGRKFLCHTALEWQKAFLHALGLQEDEILQHDPGRTYICRDLQTVEYSVTNMTVSALERANFFEIVNRLRLRITPRPKLFVSRLSRLRDNPNNAGLKNEAALAAMLAERGFALVEPEQLPFEAQVSLFAGAREVVCLGGPALFNTVFCAPGTRVVTIESSADLTAVHADLLASLDLDYGVIFGAQDLSDAPPRDKRWTLDLPRAAEVVDRFFTGA